MPNGYIIALWALTVIVSLFVGGFLKSYMSKKGENLATHEDIDKLVDQVSAVTRTAKEIEAKISNDVWDRQKRWEMKRELLFEATKTIARINGQLLSLSTVQGIPHKEGDRDWLATLGDRVNKYLDTTREFEALGLLMGTVCNRETFFAAQEFHVFASEVASKISEGDSEIYNKSAKELALKANTVRQAIRKELGIDEEA